MWTPFAFYKPVVTYLLFTEKILGLCAFVYRCNLMTTEMQ